MSGKSSILVFSYSVRLCGEESLYHSLTPSIGHNLRVRLVIVGPMRKTGLALLICFLPGTLPLFAQKLIEAGVFVDYLDVSQTSTNNFGLGARFGYRVHHDLMLKGELAYDYSYLLPFGQ